MAGTIPFGVPDNLDVTSATPSGNVQTLLLHAETAALSKRVRRTLVRATRTTSTQDDIVSAELNHEHVEVERVAIGRVVDVVPPIRQEGEVTIMPVVKEELVVVRRLILTEEVHLRRVQSTSTYAAKVAVRTQHVAVTRTALDD